MDMQKRNCPITLELEPGYHYLFVNFDFGADKLEFSPASTVGSLIGDFVSALYTLYHEENSVEFDGHSEWRPRNYHTKENHEIVAITTTVDWDNEGTVLTIAMTREINGDTIHLRTTTDYGDTYHDYYVNDKDFCYAVAQACTKLLKDYGIYGYRLLTEGEPIHLHQLLFIKAYALDCMEVRDIIKIDEAGYMYRTDFNKEIELLLFDM